MNDLWCPRCDGEAKTGPVYPPRCACGGLWRAREPSAYRVERDRASHFVTPVWKDPREHAVWWKREDLSRTGSFKDRGAESLIRLAKRVGASRLVMDSSGSAALAAASAAARAGLPLRVHVPADTPARMLAVLGEMGAEALAEGTRADAAMRALEESSRAFYASHVHHPAFTAGTAEAGFEALAQMRDVTPSMWILPVGNGSLLLGLHEALQASVRHAVRLVAVQAAATAGLLRPGVAGRTRARGIAIADPPRREEILAAVRRSGGEVLEVSEEDIAGAEERLWKRGLAVESASAAALAGLTQLRSRGLSDPVLGWLTGCGHRV